MARGKRAANWRDFLDADDKELPAMADDFTLIAKAWQGGGFVNAWRRFRHGKAFMEIAGFYSEAYATATADHDKLVDKARRTVGSLCSMLGGTYTFPTGKKGEDKKDKD